MKTLIEIPTVGEVRAHTLDPENARQVQALVERAEAYFNLAANAWIDGNNSGDSEYAEMMDARCDRQRKKAQDLLAPLGIKCTYPGLYPAFEVGGFHYYTTEAAVKAATEARK